MLTGTPAVGFAEEDEGLTGGAAETAAGPRADGVRARSVRPGVGRLCCTGVV